MKKNITLMAVLLLTTLAHAKEPVRKLLFDDGWQFALNDSTLWRPVNLPHDWSIEQSFNKDAPAGNDGAYLPTGKGWYRKELTMGKELAGKTIRLYFEGVYMLSEVYVNGQYAGGHPYGYSSFFVDITPYLSVGKNTLEVRVDNSRQKNCRWYSGSGIYRHVWLLTTPSTYLDEWGSYLRADQQGRQWSLHIETPLAGDTGKGGTLTFRHTLYDADGQIAGSSQGNEVNQTIRVDDPHLWSPDHPYLYTVKTQLLKDGKVIDELTHTTGFRTISYDSRQGFMLNGTPLLINGGCLHHDNGILGSAAFDRAEQRKAELIKKAGFNAVRTSHNLPTEAFLNACDEEGLLVIDEAFDGWREKKNDHDYHELIDQWWQDDLRAMLCRDRNHPSIFCWSIGNEVMERKKLEVVKTAHMMAQLCHDLDEHRRPVTSALASWDSDWDIYDPLASEHDIVGYNYMIHKAESDHQRVPERVMLQTESYPRDAWKNYRMSADHPYVIGDFVWTAIDYLGESGIGRSYYEGDVPGEHWERPLYPWHAAYCGDIDLTGLLKPIGHYRSMLWNANGEQIYMAVREPNGYHGQVKETQWGTWPTYVCWNWPGHEGRPIDVEVYSKHPVVRLYLNDQLIDEKRNSANNGFKVIFTLPYQPGTLRAEGLTEDGSSSPTTFTLQTSSDAKTICFTADRSTLKADGQDLSFITLQLLDANGIPHPSADHVLSATIKGPGTLAAFGNADIKDCDSYVDATHKAWHGRALLVVRSGQRPGTISVTVSGKGLSPSTIQIKTK